MYLGYAIRNSERIYDLDGRTSESIVPSKEHKLMHYRMYYYTDLYQWQSEKVFHSSRLICSKTDGWTDVHPSIQSVSQLVNRFIMHQPTKLITADYIPASK